MGLTVRDNRGPLPLSIVDSFCPLPWLEYAGYNVVLPSGYLVLETCIGYLDHPFKNKPVETEKDHLRLFANTEGWCRIRRRRPHPQARTTIFSWDGEAFCMAGMVTYLLRLKNGCLDALSSRFTRWTKPLRTSLPLATLTDLDRSKSELIAENALLRQQLIILRRQVKRPACTKTVRLLLVLLTRIVRTWKQTLLIVQPETLRRLASGALSLVLQTEVQDGFSYAEGRGRTVCLDQKDGDEQSALGC